MVDLIIFLLAIVALAVAVLFGIAIMIELKEGEDENTGN